MTVDAIIVLALAAIAILITFIKQSKQVGTTWAGPVSAKITIKDKSLHCSHCGHDKFGKREGLLTTTWVTFFRFAFWNQSARCFICKNCGFLHWFIAPNEDAEIERDIN